MTASDVEVLAHALVDPDPEAELAFVERRVSRSIEKIQRVTSNLGSAFDYAQRLVGFTLVLDKPRAEIVAALRTLCELGVALFRRGAAAPSETITFAFRGQEIRVPGANTHYNSAPRWIQAFGAALALRDRAAIDSLSRFDPAAFQGDYDRYHDALVPALVSLAADSEQARAQAQAHLAEAERLVGTANVAREHAQRIGAPAIAVAQAVLAGDEAAYNERLAEGLTWYRTLYERPKSNHRAEAMLALRYLGLCALAHDRGLTCRVESAYIPRWLVTGDLDG